MSVSLLLLVEILLENFPRFGIATKVFLPKKMGSHFVPHIVELDELLEEVEQAQQLPILVEMVVGQDGDPIIRLQHNRKARIIHQDTVLQSSVHTSQILSIEPLLQRAVLSVESVREEPLMGVEVVQNNVSVGGAAGGEDDDLRDGRQLAQEIDAMRTHSDACLDRTNSTETVEPPSTGKSNLTV